jgi:hypothetical protein
MNRERRIELREKIKIKEMIASLLSVRMMCGHCQSSVVAWDPKMKGDLVPVTMPPEY